MLLQKLINLQLAEGSTDAEFAAQLGVGRSTWQLTRTGRIGLGRAVARAARRAFPELEPDVIAFFLSSGATAVAVGGQSERAAS